MNFLNKYPKVIKYFLFFILLFFIVSCPDPSSNNDLVTISGTVTLEGETDHSGVTIALYKPVELDTALVRINKEYFNIGVQISHPGGQVPTRGKQETEFKQNCCI